MWCLRQGCENDVYESKLDKQVLVTLLCRADKQQNVDSFKWPWTLTSVLIADKKSDELSTIQTKKTPKQLFYNQQNPAKHME